MTYVSIQQIKSDFDIHTDDVDVLLEHLKEVRNKVHPNSTQGNFVDAAQKETYYKVEEAIEYANKHKGNDQLMVVSKMTDLMKVMVAELIPANKQNSLEQHLETKITKAVKNHRSKLFIPKVSLTAFTTVLSFLYFMPTQIKANPTMSLLVDPTSRQFAQVWVLLLVSTALFWIISYYRDQKSKNLLSLLKVESTQNIIFSEFLEINKEFTKDKLTRFIFGYYKSKSKEPFIRLILNNHEIISLEIAQNTAEVILSRAEKKNAIKKIADSGLSDKYETLA